METKREAILSVNGLTKQFGGLVAINNVSLNVYRGELYGLIGPNGAGKSTIFNMIGGSFKPTRGKITFDGQNITGFPPHRVSLRGIARVYQGNILFHNLSVRTNVFIGCHSRTGLGFCGSFIGNSASRNIEKSMYRKVEEILQLVGLSDQADQTAINLSHGNQRLLCLAVALASDPKLMLLDEPVTGMNTEEVNAMVALIRTLREKTGVTCMIVEHNMKAVMSLCERIVVISYGTRIAEGTPAEISTNPQVIEAYLGEEQNAA